MSNILPYDKVTSQQIVKFTMEIYSLVLNTSATFRVSMYNIHGNVIDNVSVIIEGDDYKAWNNDDNYVVQYVASKLGFTLC